MPKSQHVSRPVYLLGTIRCLEHFTGDILFIETEAQRAIKYLDMPNALNLSPSISVHLRPSPVMWDSSLLAYYITIQCLIMNCRDFTHPSPSGRRSAMDGLSTVGLEIAHVQQLSGIAPVS